MTSYRQLRPNKDESDIARVSKQQLSQYANSNESLTVKIVDAEQSESVELPAGAVSMLIDILDAMAAGQGITIIPEQAELTTGQAADLLNVSRPYVVKLLEEGQIPFHMVGKHRRVRLEDVIDYKKESDKERLAALDELVELAQEHQMGYE